MPEQLVADSDTISIMQASAFFIVVFSWIIANFLAIRVFKMIPALGFFVAFLPVYLIYRGNLVGWEDVVHVSVAVGVAVAFVLSPFSVALDFEERIKRLEAVNKGKTKKEPISETPALPSEDDSEASISELYGRSPSTT